MVVDVKEGGRTIKPGPDWRTIKTRQEFDEASKGCSAVKAATGAKVYRIEGDDGEIWGFFFAPMNVLPFTVIDDKTIQLGSIPPPKAPGGP